MLTLALTIGALGAVFTLVHRIPSIESIALYDVAEGTLIGPMAPNGFDICSPRHR